MIVRRSLAKENLKLEMKDKIKGDLINHFKEIFGKGEKEDR